MTKDVTREIAETRVQETRPAAHAGTLYPADPTFLTRLTDSYIAEAAAASKRAEEHQPPKAIIAPHGGFIYSGRIAGHAFAPWGRHTAERVVLLGPSHSLDFPGIALPDSSVFATPLGELTLDHDAARFLDQQKDVRRFEA